MKLDRIALCYMLSAPAARAFAVISSRHGVRSSCSASSKKSLRRTPFAMVSTAADAAAAASDTSATAADEASNPLLDQKGLPRFASIEPKHLSPAVSKVLEGKNSFETRDVDLVL